MAKTITHQDVVEKIKLINPNIQLLSYYVNAKTKLKCKCLIDGYEWDALCGNLFKGCGCPQCGGKMRLTTQQYSQKLKDNNIQVECIGEYVNTHTKILHKCLLHNVEWMSSPSNVLSGRGCPKCFQQKTSSANSKSEKQYIDELKLNFPNILLIGKYINTKTKTLHKCLQHNVEWEITPEHILRGQCCGQCKIDKIKNATLKSHNEFVKQLQSINDNIILLDTYSGTHKKHLFKCNVCHNEWYTHPSNVINVKRGKPSGCPRCASSKLENKVQKWLDNNNISYVQQYRIADCKYKQPLPFDFALFQNNALSLLIETDGEQHFSPIRFGGMDWEVAKQKFKEQKLKDNIKNKYCHDNNIKLLRIPYWEFDNIEKILCNELLKGGG